MPRDLFAPDNDKFKCGDLVRVTDESHPEQVKFARVFRVHQAWVEINPGEGPMKSECEVLARDTTEDYGFVAIPESELKRLWRLADAAGDPVAATLYAELERVKALPWRAET